MNIFTGLSKTAVVMSIILGLLFPTLFLIGFLVIQFVYPFEQILPFGTGLFGGMLISLVKVILLEKSITKAVQMDDGGRAKNYANLQSILRYIGTFALIAGAVCFPKVFGLFGIIVGILSLQLAAYITAGVLKIKPELIGDSVHIAQDSEKSVGNDALQESKLALADNTVRHEDNSVYSEKKNWEQDEEDEEREESDTSLFGTLKNLID